MTKKGGSKHLKRLPAPAGWPIHRKEFKWVVKPRAGPHRLRRSLPLILIVRELLGLAKNRREAKMMLSQGSVKVDGRARYNDDYPIGPMDVVEIPALKKAFRVLPSGKRLRLYDLREDERGFKLCKIVGKRTVSGGDIQLNLHDGRNLLVNELDPDSPTEDLYSVRDVLKIELPEQAILDHLKFEAGVLGIVENGKNAGAIVEVLQIVERTWPSTPSAALRDREGNQFDTILDYVFPIGRGEPWISLPEGAAQ